MLLSEHCQVPSVLCVFFHLILPVILQRAHCDPNLQLRQWRIREVRNSPMATQLPSGGPGVQM